MTASLEQYVAEATRAYQPAQTAIQSQIDSLAGKLQTTNEAINRNYAQQQAGLNRQRNMAAETASMQAAGSGGSFGGAANIANRKYYDQTFVPAVTQLRTSQVNELAQARQNNEDQRTNLNSQLANLQAQANQQALAQYYSDLEAEKNRQAQLRAQREANAAQNAYYQYMMDAMRNGGGSNNSVNRQNTDFNTWLNNYSGQSASVKQFYNNAMKAVGGNSALSSTLTKKIANTPIWQQYLNWQKG